MLVQPPSAEKKESAAAPLNSHTPSHVETPPQQLSDEEKTRWQQPQQESSTRSSRARTFQAVSINNLLEVKRCPKTSKNHLLEGKPPLFRRTPDVSQLQDVGPHDHPDRGSALHHSMP